MSFQSVAAAGLALLAQVASAQSTIVPAGTNVSWPYHHYVSAPTLKAPYVAISKVEPPSEGYIFLAPDGADAVQQAPLILDNNGVLVWNGPSEHAFGFNMQTYKGQSVLVGWNGTLYPDPLGGGYGVITIRDNHYNVIKTVPLKGHFVSHTAGLTFPSWADLHENIITPQNTLLVTAHNTTPWDLSPVGGPKNGFIVDDQAYEIDIETGKIVWSWKSLDHIDELPYNLSLNKYGTDGFYGESVNDPWTYFHINAFDTYDGGFLISSRYFASAIAVNRETGNVTWRADGVRGGDFKLGKGLSYRFQHHVRQYKPSPPSYNSDIITLSMHDNHNCPFQNGSIISTGKIIDLNLKTKQATLRTTFKNASNPLYSVSTGSLTQLPNGNWFLGRGSIPIIEEYSSTGEILSTIQFGYTKTFPKGIISNTAQTLSYRSFKQPWIGCPLTKPSLVIQDPSHNGSGVTLYISWNGATQVSGWKIYSGTKNNKRPSYTKTVTATGFETVVKLPGVAFAQVYPVFKKGTPADCGQKQASNVVFAPGVGYQRRAEIMKRIEQ